MIYYLIKFMHIFYDNLEKPFMFISVWLFPLGVIYQLGIILGFTRFVLDFPLYAWRIPRYMKSMGIKTEKSFITIRDLYTNWVFFEMESMCIVLKTKSCLSKISKRISLENFEYIQALINAKKGFIFTTAHYGSCFMGLIMLSFSLPLKCCLTLNIVKNGGWAMGDQIIAKKLSNDRLKINFIYTNTSKLNAVRSILDCIKRNEVLVMLYDVDAFSKTAVNFFGREEVFPSGIAYFSKKYHYPTVPFFTKRENNTVKVTISSPIDPQDNEEKDITQELAIRLENNIKEKPEQWYAWCVLWKPSL